MAPSFGKLRVGVTDVATTVGIILKKKRELEPDTEEGGRGNGNRRSGGRRGAILPR